MGRPKISTRANFYLKVQKDKRESLGYYEEKIKFIIDGVGEKKRVLDVGCNDGFIGEMLIKKKNKVFGVDIVKKNLQLAQRRGLVIKLVDIEKERLPFRGNYFDVVILGDIIEHVFDTDRLLEQCRRILKTGGKLIVTTPNLASFGRRLMLLFGRNPFIEFSSEFLLNNVPPVGHIRYYTERTLREQLEFHQFKDIKIKGSVLNLFFFTSHLLADIKPSLAMMLMSTAIKGE